MNKKTRKTTKETFPNDQEINSLYQNFCGAKDSLRPKIKEIITMAAKNLLDLARSLVNIHSRINNAKYRPLRVMGQLKEELESWHDDMISTGLSQRRTFSRLITDLKYHVGGLEGADELFLDIDKATIQMRQDWTPKLSSEAGDGLRQSFLDLILIIDPEISGKFDLNSKELSIIQKRLKEVERKSLTFFDFNKKILKTGQNSHMNSLERQVDLERHMETLKNNRGPQVVYHNEEVESSAGGDLQGGNMTITPNYTTTDVSNHFGDNNRTQDTEEESSLANYGHLQRHHQQNYQPGIQTTSNGEDDIDNSDNPLVLSLGLGDDKSGVIEAMDFTNINESPKMHEDPAYAHFKHNTSFSSIKDEDNVRNIIIPSMKPSAKSSFIAINTATPATIQSTNQMNLTSAMNRSNISQSITPERSRAMTPISMSKTNNKSPINIQKHHHNKENVNHDHNVNHYESKIKKLSSRLKHVSSSKENLTFENLLHPHYKPATATGGENSKISTHLASQNLSPKKSLDKMPSEPSFMNLNLKVKNQGPNLSISPTGNENTTNVYNVLTNKTNSTLNIQSSQEQALNSIPVGGVVGQFMNTNGSRGSINFSSFTFKVSDQQKFGGFLSINQPLAQSVERNGMDKLIQGLKTPQQPSFAVTSGVGGVADIVKSPDTNSRVINNKVTVQKAQPQKGFKSPIVKKNDPSNKENELNPYSLMKRGPYEHSPFTCKLVDRGSSQKILKTGPMSNGSNSGVFSTKVKSSSLQYNLARHQRSPYLASSSSEVVEPITIAKFMQHTPRNNNHLYNSHEPQTFMATRLNNSKAKNYPMMSSANFSGINMHRRNKSSKISTYKTLGLGTSSQKSSRLPKTPNSGSKPKILFNRTPNRITTHQYSNRHLSSQRAVLSNRGSQTKLLQNSYQTATEMLLSNRLNNQGNNLIGSTQQQQPGPSISNRSHNRNYTNRSVSPIASRRGYMNSNTTPRILGDPTFPPASTKTPNRLVSERIIRRVYTSGSQNTTPMRVDYHSNEVNSLTPHRWINQSHPQGLPHAEEPKVASCVTPLKRGSRKNIMGDPNAAGTLVTGMPSSEFNINEYLMNRNSEKLHIKIEGIEKIAISNDGNYLLFGGNGLHVLDMSEKKFKLIRFDKKQSKFYFR